jgi:arginine/lysine/ornithine decarboxylase
MGVKAAVLAAGVNLIAAAGSHRCVFEAAELAGVKAYALEKTTDTDIPQPVTAAEIERALGAYPDAGAVVITSPDYFGRTVKPDVTALIRERGKLLIADSAHGAHFIFRPDLFPPSLSATADFCNMSAHKTLFAFTMSAYLAVNNPDYFQKTDRALGLLGTTSPLYPLLASLETAVEFALGNADGYTRLKTLADGFRAEIPCLKNDDFTRLVVDANALGLSGGGLSGGLFKKGIAAETHTNRFTVFIATLADGEEKFERLTNAIKELTQNDLTQKNDKKAQGKKS